MKIDADFSAISSNTDKLSEGEYKFRIKSAENGEIKEGKQTPFIVTSEVVDGPRTGAEVQDWIYLKTRKNEPNKMGLGRIKAYAEATVGEDRANSKDFDTDELLGMAYTGIMVSEPYTDTSTTPPTQKVSVKLGKILPA